MTLANLNYESNLFGLFYDPRTDAEFSAEDFANRLLSRWKIDPSALPGDLDEVQPVKHSRIVRKLHDQSSKELQRAVSHLQPAGRVIQHERELEFAEIAPEYATPHGLKGLLHVWAERIRGRRELEAMNERELLDIGVTRADAQMECRKPFWRK
ncbi:MAG: DUF1127 domain-containing protein [Candidatus Lambdaproteobacteria bacterium]|nr:DUF1127 domain-containing protein [Candidatus Lambdaproteobacteria bacterium]